MSWQLGTSRGLEPQRRPRSAVERREHTPRLYSDEDRRARARSSGYGRVVAQPRISKVIPSHEEEVLAKATFKPQLNDDPIRAKVRSTGYGRGQVIYGKPAPEPERYSFKPNINMSDTAKKARKKSTSSAYGRRASEVPGHKHHDGIAPSLPFKPNLPKNKVRSAARSSGYGSKNYKPETRPKTAPATNNGNKLRYTLYADRPGKENTSDETDPSKPGFVNDGVQVAMHSQQRMKYGMHTSEPVNVYDRHELSETAKTIKAKATGSKYTRGWKPEVNQNPVPDYKREEIVEGRSEPRGMSFDRRTSLVEQPAVPENPNRDKLRSKVKSSGYKHYTPEVVPREEPEMAEPSFSTLKSDGAIKPLEELSPPPRSKATAAAGSSGYGAVSPEKVPRKPREEAPVWKPNNGKSADLGPASSLPPLPGKRRSSTGARSGSSSPAKPPTRSASSSRKASASASRSNRSSRSEEKATESESTAVVTTRQVVTHTYTQGSGEAVTSQAVEQLGDEVFVDHEASHEVGAEAEAEQEQEQEQEQAAGAESESEGEQW